jgi:DoxX-like family
MTSKTKNIIAWSLTILISAFMLFGSASGKFLGGEALQPMFDKYGLGGNMRYNIGALEVFCTIIFLIPRTGVIGTLLLAAYMGGAIVTHLEHDESYIFQIVISALIWICAFIRFPELTSRLLGKNHSVN